MSLNRQELPKQRIHERDMVTIFESSQLADQRSIYEEQLYLDWLLKNPQKWKKLMDFRASND